MAHPNSLRNLRPPWRPGQAPNPQGINKKRPFSDRYAEMGQAQAPIELIQKLNKQFGKPVLSENCSWCELVTARAYLSVVLRGDTNMLREIADRVEGRAPQRLDLAIPAHSEVTLKVVYDTATPKKKPDHTAVEGTLFTSIVVLIKQSPDDEDEVFLTKLGELGQMIQERAKQRGRTIDVPKTA